MKTNLNIAYLNGAEGMIRRGASGSGGSGSGGENENSWRYFDIAKIGNNNIATIIIQYFATILKATTNDGQNVFASAGLTLMGGLIPSNCVAVCTNIPMTYEGGEVATFEEACIKYNVTDEDLTVREITKEEFYSLE